MNFEEGLAVTQERLAGEAGSMAEVLERLRGRISPVLIGDREWESVLERARDLPAAVAAFPFGFRMRCTNPPGADRSFGCRRHRTGGYSKKRADKPDPQLRHRALLGKPSPTIALCQIVRRR